MSQQPQPVAAEAPRRPPPRRAPPARRARPERPEAGLYPDPDLRGLKVTLGAGWALGTAVALFAGSIVLGLWMCPVAGLAAVQAGRSWRRTDHAVAAPAAGAAAAVVVALAGFGVAAAVVGAIAGLVGAAAWAVTQKADPLRTVACAAVPAVAAASPVLLRATDGLVAPMILLAYAVVYDAGAWTIGSGARWAWAGPAAGIACIGTVTLGVAGVFPQFKGSSAWELGALAAVLAPLGPVAATLVLGSRRSRAPALRRLDSLVVLAPVWALAAVAMGI